MTHRGQIWSPRGASVQADGISVLELATDQDGSADVIADVATGAADQDTSKV